MKLKRAINVYLQKPNRRARIGFLQHDIFEEKVSSHIDTFVNLHPALSQRPEFEIHKKAQPFLPCSWACPPVTLYKLNDVFVHSATGIVYLPKSQSFIEEFSWGWGKTRTNQLRKSIEQPITSGRHVQSCTYVFTGSGYHGLLEDIPAVLELTKRNIKFDIIINSRNLWMINLLKFLGIPSEKIRTTDQIEWINLESAVLISKAPHAEYIHPNLIKNITDYPISENQFTTGSKKVFIRRNDANARHHPKENLVADKYSRAGYSCLSLSKLTIPEQINTFVHASEIAGFHGAGLANIVWCKNTAVIKEIYSSQHFNPCYFCLSMSLKHHYHLSNVAAQGIN
jgi:hypothetical protein